jgi:ribosomal protein S6--L-glutamate ligase
MKLALLTRNAKLYSHLRLIQAAKDRGHEIVPIDYLRCHVSITSMQPSLRFRGTTLTGFDAVIPRIAASRTFFGLAVLRQFEMMGVWPLNESVAIGRSRDKLRCLQLLARDGVGLPVTAFAHYTTKADEVIEIAGGAPVVIKLLEGTQGIGVVLGETHQSAKSMIEAFRGANTNILVQEFIRESSGRDIRAFVIGGEVVAAMERRGPAGDFRSNLHRGGSARAVDISPQERKTAIRAARTMGLNVAGVDMLRSAKGVVVMEVNSSPGLEGIEAATGIDIASKIVEFIEEKHRPGQTRTRGRG